MGDVHQIAGSPPATKTDSGSPLTNGESPLKGGAETTVAAAELRQFVERIERLHEEKAGIESDIADVLTEAKSRGYDKKALRAIVRLRRKDPNECREEEAVLDLYKHALGMD